MIIIGTTALKYFGVSLRDPKDIDVMASSSVDGYDTVVVPQDIIDTIPNEKGYATVDAVYTIKCSHLGWDIKWPKHKSDVLRLKAIGAKKIPELYDALVNYWREVNGNKPFLSMYKKKSDFFNDYVPYVYEHDYLHELVAYPNKPVYELCLKDGEDVAIDKDKFFELPLDLQLKMFKEEISVIAAERWLIPPKVCGKFTWQQAYFLAVHKTVTALTKNWATDFLIEHLDYFVRPDYKYFEHLLNTVKEGETIMGKRVENWEEIVNEILEAYNETEPRWPAYYSGELEEIELDGFEMIEDFGGGEGDGEYAYYVFKWKDKYYKLEYAYYSFVGADFDNATMYEVTPVEKTVTVYE